MAQSTPKIEDLRFRLKADPKSRLFFPLAEELRKVGEVGEAEHVLRTGLTHHPTYLSAWVSLGRALREAKKNGDAVEALNKALQIDPGNVVAARLLADAYLDLGEKVEAIKKYKLVHALLPADEDLEALIERLDEEINPVTIIPPAAPEPPPAPEPEPEPEPQPIPESPFAAADTGDDTGDEEPMAAAHAESPFEDPAPGYTAAAIAVEQPAGMHIDEPPPDLTSTVTMADLYASQGLVDDARNIYEDILLRDPNNDDVRNKLLALDQQPVFAAAPEPEPEFQPEPEPQEAPVPQRDPRVVKLESWLARVARRESPGV